MDTAFTVRRLNRPVTHEHRNFWGHKSSLQVIPKGLGTWDWDSRGRGITVPIDASRVSADHRRFALVAQNRRFEVYEHVGCLRYGGILGVTLVGDGWLPYDGRAEGLWARLSNMSVRTGEAMPLYTCERTVSYEYPKGRGPDGAPSYTEILPSEDGTLTLDIQLDFPGIGSRHDCYVLPDVELFTRMCCARTLGNPPCAYWIARLARCAGWPHFNDIAWPQVTSDKNALLEEISLHRALDILGALSLLCGDGLFVGHVTSCYSGHLADINAVRQASGHLTRIG